MSRRGELPLTADGCPQADLIRSPSFILPSCVAPPLLQPEHGAVALRDDGLASAAFLSPPRKIKSITLDSARLEQRTSFAAGFVDGDRLLLFPIDQASLADGTASCRHTEVVAGLSTEPP